MSYADFIDRKLSHIPPTGLAGNVAIASGLFDFQQAARNLEMALAQSSMFQAA